jgi:hypothetical protein
MNDTETLRYRVNLKSIKQHPSVGTDGVFNQMVMFRAEPLDNGIAFDVEVLVGGEALRRCRLLAGRTHVIVDVAASLPDARPTDWRQEVVNLALEEAAQEHQA